VPAVASPPVLAPCVVPSSAHTPVVRLNVGGPGGSFGGEEWEDDQYFSESRAFVRRGDDIAGTDADDLYRSQRRAHGGERRLGYQIPVPDPGTYLVRLHLAETHWGAPGGGPGEPGRRVFSVNAEGGKPELRDYDIFERVGAMTATTVAFAVQVDDRRLDLAFEASAGHPSVAAIEVLAVPVGEAWVDVDRSAGTVALMIGQTPVASYAAGMTADSDNGFQAAAVGTYRVVNKVAGPIYSPYPEAYVMYWVGFDPARDNGFHGQPVDGRGNTVPGGTDATWGCVVASPRDAAQIYAFVSLGTRVEIHW